MLGLVAVREGSRAVHSFGGRWVGYIRLHTVFVMDGWGAGL
jgi:hypothetical protein